MESSTLPNLRHSMSASRISSVDVSQLDKINAIPNKTTNNVLLDGLCQEDQLYLDALMDEDSSGSDEDWSPTGAQGSPWSPAMAELPRMNNKRIKRIKPSYTITMSLEDISYIRPSWGLSKGIVKKLEAGKLNKQANFDSKKNDAGKFHTKTKTKEGELNEEKLDLTATKSLPPSMLNAYNVSLVFVILILSSLMLLSYYVSLARESERTLSIGLELHERDRTLKILIFKDGQLVPNRELRLRYGRGLPSNLRHDECTCQMYHLETRKHLPADQINKLALDGKCYACHDWAMRANLQVLVNRSAYQGEHLSGHEHKSSGTSPSASTQQEQTPLDEDFSISCYDIRWQSYDSLTTPLVDCIQLNEGDQWLGLGDIHSSPSIWPLNKFNLAHPKHSIPLVSNLSGEFNGGAGDLSATQQLTPGKPRLFMGSQVDLELISSSGFYVGNLRSDFQASLRISAEGREICISAACTDRCTPIWSRLDHLTGELKYQNNLLEYSICSASSWKVHVSRMINERLRRSLLSREQYLSGAQQIKSAEKPPVATVPAAAAAVSKQVLASEMSAIERIDINDGLQRQQQQQQQQQQRSTSGLQQPEVQPPAHSSAGQQQKQQQQATKRQFEGIGLVERTIFVTSQEYIPTLDGQTLRQHVDKIVKLNLKTSPILVLDTRWQLYSGSFRINLAYFPKAKLLFEILHNKGFKVVLTVKPYIDASIGPAALNQLLDNQRLVTAHSAMLNWGADILNFFETSGNYRDKFHSEQVTRRESFFKFRNQTVFWFNKTRAFEELAAPEVRVAHRQPPYLFNCKESHEGHCALIHLTQAHNRQWLVDMIGRSSFLSQEADGILLAGAHPDSREWDANYREAMAELVDRLFYKENYYVIPQWTGNFNYVQLAPRARDWDSLRSLVDSVLTLGMLGFALVHPGSVWGDLKAPPEVVAKIKPAAGRPPAILNLDDEGDEAQRELAAERELIVRWLQVAVFLPVLQFNDLAPIDKHNLHEQLQQLVRTRKLHLVPEIKKNLPYTALLEPQLAAPAKSGGANNSSQAGLSGLRARVNPRHPAGPVPYRLPALRHTWTTGGGGGGGNQLSMWTGGGGGGHRQEPRQEAVPQQFMIGPEVVVAPVLQAGQRQKDIYLPAGMWHDELRQTNIRGGKWLRNYPIELNEIAWFTRARRRR